MNNDEILNWIEVQRKRLRDFEQDFNFLESMIVKKKASVSDLEFTAIGSRQVNSAGTIYLGGQYGDKKVIVQIYNNLSLDFVNEIEATPNKAGYIYISRDLKNTVFYVKVRFI